MEVHVILLYRQGLKISDDSGGQVVRALVHGTEVRIPVITLTFFFSSHEKFLSFWRASGTVLTA